MKKTILFAAACVVLAACSKEQQVDSIVGGENVTLKATVNLDVQSTKVSPVDPTLETVTFEWAVGDKVTISNDSGSQVFTVTSVSGTSAELEGTALSDMSSYTATYSTANSGTVSYIENSFKPVVSGSGSNTSFTLDTFCPVLALSLKGSATINTIKYYVGSELKTTLNCGTSGIALSSTEKTVYFPVLSTAEANTAKLEFYEGEVKILEKAISTSAVTANIMKFPELSLYPYYENNNFYGLGIPITTGTAPSTTTTVWAPVNCGYEPANGKYKGYKFGKMYQWGRKDGQGYKDTFGEDSTYPLRENIVTGPISSIPTDSDAAKFYTNDSDSPFNWYCGTSPAADALWGSTKTTYDPCPTGWRVPTMSELDKLAGGDGTGEAMLGGSGIDSTNGGYWFNGTGSPSVNSGVFLPAAGFRNAAGGCAPNRYIYGYYWSSSVNDNLAWTLYIIMEGGAKMISFDRVHGTAVRCVQD